MIPKDYKEQDGCYKCKCVFIVEEIDDPTFYYCHIDKSNRPDNISESFNKYYDDKISKEELHKAYKVWNKWANKREVKAWGWCPKFKKKEE